MRDDAVDTVTAGEAFHWFDAPVALAEACRVLRPGGLLAVARNVRDDTVDWVARYDEAVTSELPEGRPYRHDAGLDAALVSVDGFVDGQVLRSPNPRPSGPQLLVDRAASTSFVANAEPDARARAAGPGARAGRDPPGPGGPPDVRAALRDRAADVAGGLRSPDGRARVLAWARANHRDLPWRRPVTRGRCSCQR